MSFRLLFAVLLPLIAFAVQKVFFVMGTYAVVDFEREEDAYKAYRIMKEVEEKLSHYIENSEVSLLNRSEGKKVKLSPLTLRALRKAIEVSEKTYGHFSPLTEGRVIECLKKGVNECGEKKRLPADLLELGEDWARLKGKAAVDLGGIGKGFALEEVYRRLKSDKGFVSIAGDMKVWGHSRLLAIKDPLKDGVLAEMVNVKDVCLSTSGNYVKEHIKKEDITLVQITVAHTDCSLADAFATALFSMSRKERRRFMRKNPQVGVLELYGDGSLFINRAFRDFFSPILIR